MDIDVEQLRELMAALREFELDELEIRSGDERITLRRGGASATAVASMTPMVAHVPSMPPPPATPTGAASPASPEEEEEEGVVYITSPFVGTFYRAPNPNADPFVQKGGSFTKGQTLCIVEAMKLMNEIEAEFDGTVLDVLVENGKPVEYGDRLFKVRKA